MFREERERKKRVRVLFSFEEPDFGAARHARCVEEATAAPSRAQLAQRRRRQAEAGATGILAGEGIRTPEPEPEPEPELEPELEPLVGPQETQPRSDGSERSATVRRGVCAAGRRCQGAGAGARPTPRLRQRS